MKSDIQEYINMDPGTLRGLIRQNKVNMPTSGMSAGYAQANLVILDKEYAKDFLEFALKNPKPCPILEVLQGSPKTKFMAQDGDISTDIPLYYIYENGIKTKKVADVSDYWTEDKVGFLIGCSFSFEEALLSAGIEIRHLTQQCTVPMFKTNVQTEPVGPFSGPTMVTMRPMTPENAQRAYDITAQCPNVHGAPIHIGDPADIGITDIQKPNWGDPVEIKDGEVPVFWACGATPQAGIEKAKLPLVITHAPAHMFMTDIKTSDMSDYIETIKHELKIV